MSSGAFALRQADEVKTFTSLDLPLPVLNLSAPTSARRATNTKVRQMPLMLNQGDIFQQVLKGDKSKSGSLPGILKTTKQKIISGRPSRDDEDRILVGFSVSHLKLDGTTAAQQKSAESDRTLMPSQHLTAVDLQLPFALNQFVPETQTIMSPTPKLIIKTDETLEELRNYTILLDKYSLHNFMIYNGATLKETPEFESFKRTYIFAWGAISSIIQQLESFLSQFEIKLAIINGPKVHELAALNLAILTRQDILSCIANVEQIKPYLTSLRDACSNQQPRAAIKIQSFIRRFLASRRVNKLRQKIGSVVRIQSRVRLLLYRLHAHTYSRIDRVAMEDRWRVNSEKLHQWWQTQQTSYASQSGPRLLIHIPSMNSGEYLRLGMENIQAIQNAHIASLYHLADPDVHIVYISPVQLTAADMAYHEKFLAVLGVSTLPKRLHFIVPELINRLPSHLSLAQVLLCSTGAIKKLKMQIKRFSNVMIVPSNVGWAEKRLANYLNVSMISGDSVGATTLQSKSFAKRAFVDSSVNIPLGSHDIHSEDDLYIALSRLIASNLDVRRWTIRLNYDYNSESVVCLDLDRISIVDALKEEQFLIIQMNEGNPSAWYSRPIQLSVRKRLVAALKIDLPEKVRICRRDIYPSWDNYLKRVQLEGAVVEAEPLEKEGCVEGMCFIDPFGKVQMCGGVDLVLDDNYQVMASQRPQTLTPPAALDGATLSVANLLFTKYKVIGYVTVRFITFWDSLDNIPRIWGQHLQFGMTPAFGSLGIAAIATDPQCKLPTSLIPAMPAGRYFIHIPVAFHNPLKQSRDDVFFKLCRMRNIYFDTEKHVGCLFFMVDSVVGGVVSVLSIGSSRKKALENSIHTLGFISKQFGRSDVDDPRTWEQLSMILLRLKTVLRTEAKYI